MFFQSQKLKLVPSPSSKDLSCLLHRQQKQPIFFVHFFTDFFKSSRQRLQILRQKSPSERSKESKKVLLNNFTKSTRQNTIIHGLQSVRLPSVMEFLTAILHRGLRNCFSYHYDQLLFLIFIQTSFSPFSLDFYFHFISPFPFFFELLFSLFSLENRGHILDLFQIFFKSK